MHFSTLAAAGLLTLAALTPANAEAQSARTRAWRPPIARWVPSLSGR